MTQEGARRLADQDNPVTAAARLTAAGKLGYATFPNDCSHSVWLMMQQMGINEPYRVANAMMNHMASRGSGWRQVTLAEAAELANTGKVVVGGLAAASGSGHVVMVMPGRMRPAGGFPMRSGKPLPPSGLYPPSASGAASSWPGAHSAGEKTVRDPWTAPDWRRVTFWTKG